jgi:hypothetical protein
VTEVNADDAAVAILASVAVEIPSPIESPSKEADALAVEPTEEGVVEEILYGEPKCGQASRKRRCKAASRPPWWTSRLSRCRRR